MFGATGSLSYAVIDAAINLGINRARSRHVLAGFLTSAYGASFHRSFVVKLQIGLLILLASSKA